MRKAGTAKYSAISGERVSASGEATDGFGEGLLTPPPTCLQGHSLDPHRTDKKLFGSPSNTLGHQLVLALIAANLQI